MPDMPMQPKPSAETRGPLAPSERVNMAYSLWVPRGGSGPSSMAHIAHANRSSDLSLVPEPLDLPARGTCLMLPDLRAYHATARALHIAWRRQGRAEFWRPAPHRAAATVTCSPVMALRDRQIAHVHAARAHLAQL